MSSGINNNEVEQKNEQEEKENMCVWVKKMTEIE